MLSDTSNTPSHLLLQFPSLKMGEDLQKTGDIVLFCDYFLQNQYKNGQNPFTELSETVLAGLSQQLSPRQAEADGASPAGHLQSQPMR